jgi:hypothetical protein
VRLAVWWHATFFVVRGIQIARAICDGRRFPALLVSVSILLKISWSATEGETRGRLRSRSSPLRIVSAPTFSCEHGLAFNRSLLIGCERGPLGPGSGHAPISREKDVRFGQDSAGEHLRRRNSFGHSQVARVWRAHNQREERKDFFEAMMWLLALLIIAVCIVLLGVVITIAMVNDQVWTPEERAAWDRQHRDQGRRQP